MELNFSGMEFPEDPQNILFICTGNSCRSVFAEAVLRRFLADEGRNLRVHSAGTAAPAGKKASEQTLAFLKKEGLDGELHRTRKITRDMIEEADIIFVMEKNHRKMILAECPAADRKIFLLSDFYPAPEHLVQECGIPDPMGMGDFFHESVNEMITICCENVMNQLRETNRWNQPAAGFPKSQLS